MRSRRGVRKGCLELPDPSPLDIFDHVYAEQHLSWRASSSSSRRTLPSFEGAR